jgi:hypothetical protein
MISRITQRLLEVRSSELHEHWPLSGNNCSHALQQWLLALGANSDRLIRDFKSSSRRLPLHVQANVVKVHWAWRVEVGGGSISFPEAQRIGSFRRALNER